MANVDPLATEPAKDERKLRKKRTKIKQEIVDSGCISEWSYGQIPQIVEVKSIKQRGRPRKNVNCTCVACHFQARDVNSLAEHVSAAHADLKLHVCPMCGANFNQKGNLIVHMKIHESVRPYACDKCAFTAVQKNNLYNHQRTHTKEKPYVCSECDYRAAQLGTLRGHYERRHGMASSMPKGSYVNSFFQCTQCIFVCQKLKDLTKHQHATHHE